MTPIQVAVLYRKTESAKKLLELGADLTKLGSFPPNKGTALDWAKQCGNKALFDLMTKFVDTGKIIEAKILCVKVHVSNCRFQFVLLPKKVNMIYLIL